jgi:hypothetical protein
MEQYHSVGLREELEAFSAWFNVNSHHDAIIHIAEIDEYLKQKP